MDVASELNKDVITDFPVLEAVGKLEPGVYVITARPVEGLGQRPPMRTQRGRAARRAMDGRLRSWSDGDLRRRRRARNRAIARLRRAARRRRVRLIAHNNEVLATKSTGADGRVDFDPGLSRGKGGSAPGLLVATLGDDYGFLNLTQNAFDLTDRGVAGRDAPRGLDAFLYTERGVYRSGETVFVTALLRDAKGEAKTGLPLTLVVKRPDGVEYKRATLADQGLGGRAFAIPLLSGSAAGNGRSRPTPIRRARASAGSSSCSRTTFPSGSISPCNRANRSSIRASRSSFRSTRGSSTARRRAGST